MNKIYKTGILPLLVFTSGLMASCEGALNISPIDERPYAAVDMTIASLRNAETPVAFQTVELFSEDGNAGKGASVECSISKAVGQTVELRIEYNEGFVSEYNRLNQTSFEAFPSDAFTIQDDGVVLIAPGDTEAHPLQISFDRSKLSENIQYMLPLHIAGLPDGIQPSSSEDSYTFIVVNKGDRPSADKGTGIKTILYFGNDSNPLQANEYTMRDSGKPFFDIVCMFAANIIWDDEKKQASLSFNPWIQRMLDNADRYLRPLQERGTKVTLSILTGVSVLSDIAAREMALEVKAVLDAYGLDGVEFDDEYNNQQNYDPNSPGIEFGNWARFVYECKRVMPDKLIGVYDYGSTGSFREPIDGVPARAYISYVMEAMYGSAAWGIQNGFGGLDKSQCSPYSRHGGKFMVDQTTIERIKKEGYGYQMFFTLPDWNIAQEGLERMSQVYFDDMIQFSGKTVGRDW